MEHWYIYYEVPDARCADALPRVRELQDRLSAISGVRARLEQRIDSKSATTWMEVYEGIADPVEFGAALDGTVQATRLSELTTPRHLERFRVLSPSCA